MLRRTAKIPELRQRALEAQVLDGSEVFADPTLHRLVTNFLFTSYRLLPISRCEWAHEFVTAYQFLLDGKPVDELQVPSLQREEVIPKIKAFLAGDVRSTLELEHEDDDRSDPARGTEGRDDD